MANSVDALQICNNFCQKLSEFIAKLCPIVHAHVGTEQRKVGSFVCHSAEHSGGQIATRIFQTELDLF